jgi:heme-degrading monooxygenase HmoA
MMAKYAVIFISERSDVDDGYEDTDRMLFEQVQRQPGFLGVESLGAEGRGITVSYWESEASIAAWRELDVHRLAQQRGRSTWYQSYRVQVCRIEREYSYAAGAAGTNRRGY